MMETDKPQASSNLPEAGINLQSYLHHELPPSVLMPDDESIHEVLERLKLSKVLQNPYGSFHDLHDGRGVKHQQTSFLNLEEALIMDFIRTYSSIPIPRVHMIFERDGLFYIVMDFVPGKRLSDLVFNLPMVELEAIAWELLNIISQIRTLPVGPQSLIGACGGRPFRNTYFRQLPWDDSESSVVPAAAFGSVAEFHAYFVTRARRDIPLENPESIPVVLSHGDLAPRNIIIEDGKITAIIDWETFGWYPEYWETVTLHRNARASTWKMALSNIIRPRNSLDQDYSLLLYDAYQEPLRYSTIARG